MLTNTKEFIKTKFSYEGVETTKPEEIFGVWLVSPCFENKELMSRSTKNPKIWEIEIELPLNMLNELEYYFEVKLYVEVEEEMPKKLTKISTSLEKTALKNP